jgi:HPt (histidine-containing phosphotransfer) domain-containing protein
VIELWRSLPPAAGAGTAEGFDPAEALARVCGNAAILAELASLFLEDGPLRLGEIRSALGRGDALALRRAAHTLSGSASSLAARPTQEAAARLELLAQAGDLAGAAEQLPALEDALGRLWPALARLVEEAAARPPLPRNTIKDRTPLPWRRLPIQEFSP